MRNTPFLSQLSLQTERLVLRRFRDDEQALYFQLNVIPEIIWLDPQRHNATLPGRMLVSDRHSGAAIGLAGLRYLPELDAVDIGYRVLPEVQGRGYAVEACAALLAYARHTLQLETVIALIGDDNPASQRVAARLGLHLQRHVVVEAFGGGTFGLYR